MGKVRLLVAAVVVTLLGLGWAVSASAATPFQSGDTVTVPAGQTQDSMLFAAGRSIDIAGTVNGDVLCAGQSVTVTGTVNGDLFCAAQTITVTGTVTGSMRVAGQSISVEGKVGHNLAAAGQSVTIGGSGAVTGDAMIVGQSATLNGTVGRDVYAGSTALSIDNTVGRNVSAQVDTLTLDDHAAIGGDIAYASTRDLSRASGATVGGSVKRTQPTTTNKRNERHTGVNWASIFYMFAAGLLMALVAVLLFARIFHAASDVALASPLKTLGLGLLVSIAAPVVIVLLFVTVIGAPLALIALLAWIFIWAVSWLFSAYYAGRMLLRSRTDNSIWYMLLGAALILIVGYIPFIGFLVWMLAFILGIGIIAMQVVRLPRPRYATSEK